MAEVMLRTLIEKKERLNIRVISAGTPAKGGISPAANTMAVMKNAEIYVSGYRTRVLTDEMIKTADVILVMEKTHKDEVIARVKDAAEKTFLLTEFKKVSKEAPLEIKDPMGLPIEEYEKCLAEIKREIERIEHNL